MIFPFSEAMPVAFSGPPPKATDVVVIGGGVMGVMSALFLRRAGLRVTLLEKGRIAGEQSSRNWGWVRAQGRDEAELPISIEAIALWRQLAEECGEDIGLVQSGVVFVASTQKQMAKLAKWQAFGAGNGVDCVVVQPREIAAMMPGVNSNWIGGIYTASDMRAEPSLAVPAIARMAAREGVVIVENCAVRGLDVAAGRIAGVFTENGKICANEVVVAGGAWSRLLLQRHGVAIPQISVRSSVVATQALPEVFGGQVLNDAVSFRRRADGGYTLASHGRNELYLGRDAMALVGAYWPAIRQAPFDTSFMPFAPAGYPDAWGQKRKWSMDEISPFERLRVLNPAANPRRVRRALASFEKLFPQLGTVKPRVSWAGMIDAMPDFVPIIDRADTLPGLTIATGLSGHGFGIGPGFGRIVSALVTGGDVGHDISRFRLSRFTDGSKLHLGPAL